jgi:membrane associated rhomboid family serine protease
MGIHDREYYREGDGPGVFLGGQTMVMKLVIVNLVVFLANLFFGGQHDGVTDALSFHSENIVQPWFWWRLITCGFVHDPNVVGHIFMNMFVLWLFGREVEGIYGSREFLAFYLCALILGSLTWGLRQWVHDSAFTVDRKLLGASGAVTAAFLLFVLHYPRRTILLMFVVPVPAWLLGLLYVLGDLVGFRQSMEGGLTGVAFDVHLVGAAFALLYWRFGLRMSTFLPTRWRWNKNWFRRRPKLKVHKPAAMESSPEIDEQADAILEKVNQHGLDSLTPNERRILEAYSRRMQQKRR